jgi:hypothetical protein
MSNNTTIIATDRERLMSLADELKELELLLRNGTLTQEEFQIAKRRVLDGSPVADHSDQLEAIQAQNEIAQLDREWILERESYMMTGKYGRRFLPNKFMSVLGGIVVGCFWTFMALSMGQMANAAGPMGSLGIIGIVMPLFGAVLVIFGVSMSIFAFVRAGQYQEAYRRYQARRGIVQSRS